MNNEGATLWSVEVLCLEPTRKRSIPPVAALSEDQAVILAERKASEMFGKKGESWSAVEVHMQNIT